MYHWQICHNSIQWLPTVAGLTAEIAKWWLGMVHKTGSAEGMSFSVYSVAPLFLLTSCWLTHLCRFWALWVHWIPMFINAISQACLGPMVKLPMQQVKQVNIFDPWMIFLWTFGHHLQHHRRIITLRYVSQSILHCLYSFRVCCPLCE